MSRSGVRQLTGRATWNILDQVVSSGTNVLLSLLVARSLSADGFGAFAVAFTVYAFLVGAGRALIAQPLVVRYASQDDGAFRDASRSAAGAATALGAAAGGTTLAGGLLIGGPTGACLIAIGVLLPGLLLQDMWRAVFVSQGRPAAALVNDVVWGITQFALVGCFLLLGQRSAVAMLVGWGGAALAAAVLGGFQFRGHPQVRSSLSWMRQQRDLVGYYAASFFAVMGASHLTMLLIAGLGEPSDVGALRAAQVVLGPLNLLGYSISAFALPEISRRQLRGAAGVKAAVAISSVMVLAATAWGLALLYLPDTVGEGLLGDSWSNAQAVLPATLLGVVAVGVGLGATTLLVARGFAKETFLVSLVLAPGFLVLGVVGLQVGDAPGAALGLSIAQCLVTPLVWWRALVLMRRESRPTDGPGHGPGDRSTSGLAGAVTSP